MIEKDIKWQKRNKMSNTAVQMRSRSCMCSSLHPLPFTLSHLIQLSFSIFVATDEENALTE